MGWSSVCANFLRLRIAARQSDNRVSREVRISLQHFPILVPSHERDLLDFQTSLEQTACRLVTKVVEVEIVDSQVGAGAAESGADGPGIVGEGPSDVVIMPALLIDEGPAIISRQVHKWHFLMIAVLLSRILAIAHGNNPPPHIHVIPFEGADFGLAHSRCDGETYDPAHRGQVTSVGIEKCKQLIQFFLRWSTVSLTAFADQPEPIESDPGKLDFFCGCVNAVNGLGMKKNGFQIGDVHANGRWTGAFDRPMASKIDNRLPVDLVNPDMTDILLEFVQRVGFRAAQGLAGLVHVRNVEVDLLPEGYPFIS